MIKKTGRCGIKKLGLVILKYIYILLYNRVICNATTFQLFQIQEFKMAKGSVTIIKIIGVVLVVLGLGLAIWGYQLSTSVGSQVTQAVTGADTDKVMTFYIVGAVSFFVGLYLFRKN
jgi:hypothetical protein